MIRAIKIAGKLRKPDFSFRNLADRSSGVCNACGNYSQFDYEEIIHDDLARLWGVNDKIKHSYSSRESRQCKHCGAIYRNRQYAQVLCEHYGSSCTKSLRDLVAYKGFRELSIAEINACGHLHQFLKELSSLAYSEFEAEDKTISSESLLELSYGDDSFDLVLTSDTFEHVPDYKTAFKEIHRVLKTGGSHIFTIPIVWQNATRRRAEYKEDGTIDYLMEPAYHGPTAEANLVWTDFGYDIIDEIDSYGFDTTVEHINVFNEWDVGGVFVSRKK